MYVHIIAKLKNEGYGIKIDRKLLDNVKFAHDVGLTATNSA